jgi:hypothetical protein
LNGHSESWRLWDSVGLLGGNILYDISSLKWSDWGKLPQLWTDRPRQQLALTVAKLLVKKAWRDRSAQGKKAKRPMVIREIPAVKVQIKIRTNTLNKTNKSYFGRQPRGRERTVKQAEGKWIY